MRVLHVFKTYYPDSLGGVEQVIRQLSSATSRMGVSNQIFTLSRQASTTPVLRDGATTIIRAKTNLEIASTPMSYPAISAFRAALKQVDLVHYHYPWPFGDLLHLLAGQSKPAVLTYHSDVVRQQMLMPIYRPLMRRFFTKLRAIVPTSPNYLQSSELLQDYRDKTTIIPIGLDQHSYPEPASARIDHWRSEVGQDFFLFVGVMRYYKGLHILLEALKDVDYPVVIVGAGPLEQELHAQAAALGLRNIHFLGRLGDEDKVALLQLSYAIVFPSHLRSEAFGISLLEGAMYGKPMISSEIGTGTSYINIHNETGLVVPPSHPQAFREAMRTLWENPTRAAEMGVKAEARYRQLFTADEMGRKWTELYQDLLEEKALSYA